MKPTTSSTAGIALFLLNAALASPSGLAPALRAAKETSDNPPPAYFAESTGPAAAPPLTAYAALGATMTQNSHLNELGWSEQEIGAFLEGVRGAFQGKSYPFDPQARKLSGDLDQQIHALEIRRRHAELASPSGLAAFLKDMQKKASLRETDSGMYYRFLQFSSGIRPRPDDTVVIGLQCMVADDMTPVAGIGSGHLRTKVNGLLPGLAEGVQMMTLGSRAIFLVPPDLSFGQGEWPAGVDRGMPLAFVVVLEEIESPPAQK